jgi:hypothetical protein
MGNPSPLFSGGKTIVPVTAIDTIVKYNLVTTDGLNADSSNVSHFGKLLGLALVNIAPTFVGRVQVYGLLINALWSWSVGDNIFLNGTILSNTPPTTGFLVQIGYADTPTKIIITMENRILL